MHLSHTLLTLTAACGLWWAGHAWSCWQPSVRAQATPPLFAIPDSAYGSLVARTMRDSLYRYWHGGESAATKLPAPKVENQPDEPAPPPPAGRFSRIGRPPPVPSPVAAPPAPEAEPPWLERSVNKLVQLESARTRRNSNYPLTMAHKRYLDASAGWRLRLAHELDPGDAVIYEILHYHLTTQGQLSESAQRRVQDLIDGAIRHGLAPQASMSDALTGAGAALNRINDQLLQSHLRKTPPGREVLVSWSSLKQCLAHYRTIRQKADDEGWWDGIPEIRREEISAHVTMIENITETVRKTLVQRKLLPAAGS